MIRRNNKGNVVTEDKKSDKMIRRDDKRNNKINDKKYITREMIRNEWWEGW